MPTRIRRPRRSIRTVLALPGAPGAWPGADPRGAPSAAIQLGLFDTLHARRVPDPSDPTSHRFDPRAFIARRLGPSEVSGPGAEFLAKYHYSGGYGSRGPVWGMFLADAPRGPLLGLAAFARYPNPRWAKLTFRPDAADRDALRSGAWTEADLGNRLVKEQEYLDLSRFALIAPGDTTAPIGKRAASWLLGQIFTAIEERNRALWVAETIRAAGGTLPHPLQQLLRSAQLDHPRRGWGFTKCIGAFADPAYSPLLGAIYRSVGMRYGGTSSKSGRPVREPVGLRTGERLSKRTLQKARHPRSKGHATAALRLIYEGGDGAIEVRLGARLIAVESADWVRGISGAGHALKRAIREAWRREARMLRARHGGEVALAVRATGGTTTGTFPPRHRYLACLGRPFWRREVERRCIHLRDQVLAEETAWRERGRGRRPDFRSLYYPQRPQTPRR